MLSEAFEDVNIGLDIEDFRNSKNGVHPGCTFEVSTRPHKKGGVTATAEWVLEHVPGVPGRRIPVPVGMLNGLLTRISDLAGASCLWMVEECLQDAGYACRFMGTNDDSTGILAVPGHTVEEVNKGIAALMTALSVTAALFGIETNKGKMNISAFMQELNTLTIALKANGAPTVMLPSLRSLIGAVRRTPGFDWAEEAYSAMKGVTAAIKEGCDKTTATVALGFMSLTRLECTKMSKIALAQASGLPIPGGLPNLDSSPAPHLTGRPVIRSHWSVFSGPAQSAAAIVERLMTAHGPGGTLLSQKRKLDEKTLIKRVCSSVAVAAIAQQCRVLSDQSYESSKSDDLALGMGPYLATLKGPPLMFELGEYSDGLFKPEFLSSMDASVATSGLPNSIRHTVQAAFRTIINQYSVNSARRQNRIIQRALVQANIGGIPKKGQRWDPHADTSDLPKRLIVERPMLMADGKWGRVRGEVSFWWFIQFNKHYDWEEELPLHAPLVDVLTASLTVSVLTMRKVQKVLESDAMGLVEGHTYTMFRAPMSSDFGTGKLSAMDLARLLDPSPIRNAAMEMASLALRTQNADLRAVDLTPLGAPGVVVTTGDLDMIRKISYTISKHLEGGSIKGWLMPIVYKVPTLADACLYHAVGNIGLNFSAQRLGTIAMPIMKLDPVFTTITPDTIDALANSCIIHFLNQQEREYGFSDRIVGALPNADRGVADTENTLRGTSYNALMIGLQVAAALGVKVTLKWEDMQILTRKEASREAMVFLHAKPGMAVRSILGCRFEPALTAKEKKDRKEFRKKNPNAPYPPRGITDDKIVHAFCTEVLRVVDTTVELFGGRQTDTKDYSYTQNIYTTITQAEFARRGMQIVFTYKFKGTKLTHYLTPESVRTGEYKTAISGRRIEIHWGCLFHVTVACYPPHVCMATYNKNETYQIIPIAGIDCRQNILESEYSMPTVSPYRTPVVSYTPVDAKIAESVEQSVTVKSGKAIVQLKKRPAEPKVEEPVSYPGFGESRHGVLSAADNMFIRNARELAGHAASRSVAAAIAAAFMVMSPWEALRCFVVAILINAMKLGDDDSTWCFSSNSEGDEAQEAYLANLDIDLMVDKMMGESSILATIMQVRGPSMSSLFFNTTIEPTIQKSIRSFLTTEIRKLNTSTLTVHISPTTPVEEVMNEDGTDTIQLGDTVMEDSTKRMHIVHQVLPRVIQPAEPITVQIPAAAETKESQLPQPDMATDAGLLSSLMAVAMTGGFAADSELDSMAEMEEEEKKETEDAARLMSIMQVNEGKKIKLSKEVTISGTEVGEDGFQTVLAGREVKEDVFTSDFEEDELKHIIMEAEVTPFSDKVDVRKHHENLNMTAALILGILSGKAANLRGRMGGGYYAYKAKTLYGGPRQEMDVEGYKWMRVPVIAWASMVSMKAYANVVLAAFNDEVTPPSDDSAGLRFYTGRNSGRRGIGIKTVGEMKESGETMSSNSSQMVERVHMLSGIRVPLAAQRVLVNTTQNRISAPTSGWEFAAAPMPKSLRRARQ